MPAASRRARGDLDGGRDDARLVVAEVALLAGVRVEPGDGDARRGDAEVAHQRLGGLHDGGGDRLGRQARAARSASA